jgi:hypothetical protein
VNGTLDAVTATLGAGACYGDLIGNTTVTGANYCGTPRLTSCPSMEYAEYACMGW